MNDAPEILSQPEPGYWAVTLVRNGPEVGAAIIRRDYRPETDAADASMERTSHLEAVLDGKEVPIERVWLRRRRPISKAEYEFMVADSAWAKRNDPSDPKAQPSKAVDWNAMKPVY